MALGNTSTKSDLSSLYTAYQLYQNWGHMSAAQKSQAIATLGMHGYKFGTGTDLNNTTLIEGTNGSPGLSLGEAFGLFSSGYNVYALANNWHQLNTIQKITQGGGTAVQVANTAKNFGMLGVGNTGAATQASAESLAQAGWGSASNYGVGAISAKAGSVIPQGYTTLGPGGAGTIAIPTGNLASGVGAVGGGSEVGQIGGQFISGNAPAFGIGAGGEATSVGGASGTSTGAAATGGLGTIGTVAAGAGVALGAYQVYQGWGMGGTTGAINGAVGGAGMAVGLYALGATNPYLLAAVVAYSIISNAVQVGKSKDQGARDGMRGFLQKKGILDGNYQVALADGSLFDAGIDGHGNLHSVKDASKLPKELQDRAGENKLNAWDIDLTNDLDYTAGMGGSTLTRLLAGGKGKSIDQMGGQMGNAALGNVGFGQEMTQDNFNKVRDNLRAIYSKSGIKSKADGYQLANQMYAEHRIDDSDHAAMLQTLDMMYDNTGYDTAQKLMAGRYRGVEVAAQNPSTMPTETVSIPGANHDPQSTVLQAAADKAGKLTSVTPPNLSQIGSTLGQATALTSTQPKIQTARMANVAPAATNMSPANLANGSLGNSGTASAAPQLSTPGTFITPTSNATLPPASNTFLNPPDEFKNISPGFSPARTFKNMDNLNRGDLSKGAGGAMYLNADGSNSTTGPTSGVGPTTQIPNNLGQAKPLPANVTQEQIAQANKDKFNKQLVTQWQQGAGVS